MPSQIQGDRASPQTSLQSSPQTTPPQSHVKENPSTPYGESIAVNENAKQLQLDKDKEVLAPTKLLESFTENAENRERTSSESSSADAASFVETSVHLIDSPELEAESTVRCISNGVVVERDGVQISSNSSLNDNEKMSLPGPINAEADSVPKDASESLRASSQEKEDNSPLFSPPLYRQRYHFVRDILLKHGVKSVVDFGCAEPKLLAFLKFTHDFEVNFRLHR